MTIFFKFLILLLDDCTYLLAACADQYLNVFNVETGERVNQIEHNSQVLDCKFSLGSNEFFTVTRKVRYEPTSIHVYRSKDLTNTRALEALKIEAPQAVTCAVWGPLNNSIIAGCDDGSILMFSASNGSILGETTEHYGSITSISTDIDTSMFITTSEDKTAKLFDIRSLEVKKTYSLNENVNTAAISPIKALVALGGGKASVTTLTGQSSTYYDAHFFHLVFEEEIGKLKAHFGPVNSVAFSRNGKFFVTGGEDGYIKVFKFSDKFLKMSDDPETFYKLKKSEIQ